ncbi:hypothetical protein F5Y19DRAFT_24213 [Xylariaceae sp. FL1651]|nr:hypothetical protein F5Y19DRAFT_24213 [Xylariaceae sp. FL1651]
MKSDDMPFRESMDSVQSTSPLIQSTVHRPPHRHSGDHHNEDGHGAGRKLKIVCVVALCRIVASVFGFIAGVRFLCRYLPPVAIALVVFVWIAVAWNVLMIVKLLHKQPIQMSLVLRGGSVIKLGFQDEDHYGNHPRHRSVFFWVDLILVATLFGLNLAQNITRFGWEETGCILSWFAVVFQIFVTLLTVSPEIAMGHIRIERIDSTGYAIRLPQDNVNVAV